MNVIDKIRLLPELIRDKNYIFPEDVPEEFRKDLMNFLTGQTLAKRQGKIAVGKNTYKQWLKKIYNSGFDYEIKDNAKKN